MRGIVLVVLGCTIEGPVLVLPSEAAAPDATIGDASEATVGTAYVRVVHTSTDPGIALCVSESGGPFTMLAPSIARFMMTAPVAVAATRYDFRVVDSDCSKPLTADIQSLSLANAERWTIALIGERPRDSGFPTHALELRALRDDAAKAGTAWVRVMNASWQGTDAIDLLYPADAGPPIASSLVYGQSVYSAVTPATTPLTLVTMTVTHPVSPVTFAAGGLYSLFSINLQGTVVPDPYGLLVCDDAKTTSICTVK